MWRLLALGVSAAAALALVASGPGVRLGLWSWREGFELLRWAAWLGAAGAGAALIGLAVPAIRSGWTSALLAALLLGAASAAPLALLQQRARAVPPINDIATDSASQAQRAAYPEIAPLTLAVPPATALQRALAAGRSMGWEIVATDAAGGRFEAVDTTLWFGFKDEVVVRVSPAPGGSRIDVRSKSRVGRSDLGTNARRIRAFLERLK